MLSMVVIADDATSLPRLRMALRHAAALRIVATLDGRRPVGEHLSANAPDLVLVDHMCQRMNSLARLREASEHAPDATRLLLTERRDDACMADAFEAGAHAVVDCHIHHCALGALLGELAGGRLVLTSGRPVTGARSDRDAPAAPLGHLRVVADQLARGTGARA
jgi:DNA-binding NarL/FixJ family response regulator